ncbi:MAG: DUF3422 domain-containing protein [Pseudomonadota bacterium]
MTPLPNHPQRYALNAEIHARPSQALRAPLKVSYLVLLTDAARADAEWQHFTELVQRFGTAVPESRASHFLLQHGPLTVILERHTEYSRYTVLSTSIPEDDSATALDQLPADWISGLGGEMLLRLHCDLVEGVDDAADLELARERFGDQDFAGSLIADGRAAVFTDFDIQENDSNYLLLVDRGMAPLQAGRNLMRVLEINTYWLLALLAFPVAKAQLPYLADREKYVQELSRQLTVARSYEQEAALLTQLTQLEAELSDRVAANAYRFGAAFAYNDLVQQRIEDLRERRLPGLQTLQEFSQRRLAPAMQTCGTVTTRQGRLNERASSVTQLLATRVNMDVQLQNRGVLESLNRRAEIQLRLQETVEGLSIAAITYYLVGLVKYAATALKGGGVPVNADLVVGGSIPVIAFLVGFSLWRFRRRVAAANAASRATGGSSGTGTGPG